MISVIIPAYDQPLQTLRAINSLRANAESAFQILVQDDASPSVDFRPYIPPEVASVERNEVNLGFAANCNRAAKRAAHLPFLLFINQDVYAAEGFSEGWDRHLLAAFRDPTVGAVAPLLLFPDGAVQSAGGLVDGALQPVHRCLGWRGLEHPSIAKACNVSWATGAALAIRASLFAQLNGFDEGYRMYWEDVDLCWRLRDLGWHIRYEPAVRLVHEVGSTGGSPHFAASAQRWKERWVDSGKVEAETTSVHVRYW